MKLHMRSQSRSCKNICEHALTSVALQLHAVSPAVPRLRTDAGFLACIIRTTPKAVKLAMIFGGARNLLVAPVVERA